MWLIGVAMAWAGTAPGLDARLAEVAPLRSIRLVSGVPAIPETAYDEIALGSIPSGVQAVEGFAAKKAWAAAVLDVPIEKYWAAINDDPGKQAMGLLEHVKVVEGAVCAPERTVFQYLPVSLASDRWWVAKISVNHAMADQSGGRVREMKWESVPWDVSKDPEVAGWAADGMSLAFTEGAWFLVDLGNGQTLVEYYVWTDPGGAVPAGIASRFAAGSIPDTIQAMADAAQKGTGCPVR